MTKTLATATLVAASSLGCSNGTSSSSASLVVHPNVPGTIFTIVFENEDASNVISSENPFFAELASKYGRPVNYKSSTHPSLPNYIMMTSGSLNGVTTDSDPTYNVTIAGSNNIADQLDAAKIPWRAYMEDMGSACNQETDGKYSAHHNPFIYYWTMRMNSARCERQIVDFEANFANDLSSNAYRYMWITPNMCNDMHDCSTQTGDAWLKQIVTQITDSPGYKNGGALFILFDEGNERVLGSPAQLPVIIMSPNLVSAPYVSQTEFDHRSYLATVEDIFDLERLPTTKDATSLDEFFLLLDDSTDGGTERFAD